MLQYQLESSICDNDNLIITRSFKVCQLMISEDISEGYNSCLDKEQIKLGYYLSSVVRFILCLCVFLYLFAGFIQKVMIRV